MAGKWTEYCELNIVRLLEAGYNTHRMAVLAIGSCAAFGHVRLCAKQRTSTLPYLVAQRTEVEAISNQGGFLCTNNTHTSRAQDSVVSAPVCGALSVGFHELP